MQVTVAKHVATHLYRFESCSSLMTLFVLFICVKWAIPCVNHRLMKLTVVNMN